MVIDMEEKKETGTNELAEMESEFNPVPLFRYLFHELWVIALVAFLTAMIAFAATKLLISPTYRSSFSAYVNNQQTATNKDTITSSDILAAHELVETYSTILKSNRVLTAAAKYAKLNYSYSQLKGMVNTQVMEKTEIITVNVITQDPEISYKLASAIETVAPQYIKEIVEGSSMKTIDKPQTPTYPHGPSYVKMSLLGAIIGVLLSLAFLVIRFFRDDTIHDVEGVEERFNLPLLGTIPDSNEIKSQYGYKSNYGYSYGYGYGYFRRTTNQAKKD